MDVDDVDPSTLEMPADEQPDETTESEFVPRAMDLDNADSSTLEMLENERPVEATASKSVPLALRRSNGLILLLPTLWRD